jgi:class 3 adenylate cyclase
MFLDIVGFSARPNNNQTDQESNLRILALLFSEMFRIVDDYGGTVEKNTGDGLMAYFEDGAGDPPAPGSHRAIACAMTMKRCHRDLINPLIIATGYSPVSFRLSIDYGCITIARVGAPRQFNSIVAIGTTANIASKLQAYADADEVVIGEDVLYSMQPEFSGWVTRIDQNVGFYRILQDGTRRPYQAYKYSGGWVGHAY